MNRKFETTFAALCIAAALGAAISVAYRVLSQDAAGREAAKADFEGLRSLLAYVKGPSDLADPSLRARLASRYEASPGLLLVDVYERDSGDRWRMPAESPYLDGTGRAAGAPKPSYPPASTILLSSPLKGDVSGRLAVDALYVSLPQASAFGAFRDALIGLGAFLAAAAFVLAIATGARAKAKPEESFDFSSPAPKEAAAGAKARHKASEYVPEPAPQATRRAEAPTADTILEEEEESFDDEWSIEDKAAASARYQFDTLEAEEDKDELPPLADEEFDIPVIDDAFSVRDEPEARPAPFGSQAAVAAEAPVAERPARTAASPAAAAPKDAAPGAAAQVEKPEGLYSPTSGLGWESYIGERLDAELSRSASFEQDLSLLAVCYDGLTSQDGSYAEIGKAIKGFFSFRDLAFERGDDGFSIILPNIDSSRAIRMAEEFYKKLVFLAEGDFAELDLMPVYMGISSRAGRLVDSRRLVEEAAAALDRARYEKDTHIVAFRPDPDKYRQFLSSKGASA